MLHTLCVSGFYSLSRYKILFPTFVLTDNTIILLLFKNVAKGTEIVS